MSKALGRKVTYKIISVEEKVQCYIQSRRPEHLARLLVSIEKALDNGSNERLVTDPQAIEGKLGVSKWIKKNKDLFP